MQRRDLRDERRFVNRGLPAFARATARQALIKMDQKGYCFGEGRRTHQSDK
jgi:hypothetical protein